MDITCSKERPRFTSEKKPHHRWNSSGLELAKQIYYNQVLKKVEEPLLRLKNSARNTKKIDLRNHKELAINHTPYKFPSKEAEKIDVKEDEEKNVLKNLVIGKQIGQGAYALVRLGYHKRLDRKVALKIYEKEKLAGLKHKRSLQREIKIMEKLNNPYIVKLYEVLETPTQIMIVMEYVRGISLHGYLKAKSGKRLPEQEAKRLFKEIVSGISYCHSLSISHRDIKLENILLDESNTIKIIDFGFSTYIPNDKKTKVFCGTPSYMAPEIIARKEHTGPPADVWALGILLYAILCGTFPFRSDGELTVYEKITRGHVNYPEHLSRKAKALLTWMLQIEAWKRPNADQILLDVWLNSEETDLHSYSSEKQLKPCYSKINLREYNAASDKYKHSFKPKRLHTEQKKTRREVKRDEPKKDESVDSSIIESIVKLGYDKKEIERQFTNKQSHIYMLYNKIKEHRKGQNKVWLGERRHSHNITRSKSKPGLGKRLLFPTARPNKV